MAKCKFCGNTLYWKPYLKPDGAQGFIPFDDEALTQRHDCHGRERTAPVSTFPNQTAAAPVQAVLTPGQDRVVVPPAAQEETKINKMWVKYGETVEINGHTREYGLTLQVELAPFTNFWDEAQIMKKAIQLQIARWSEEDRSRVGGP